MSDTFAQPCSVSRREGRDAADAKENSPLTIRPRSPLSTWVQLLTLAGLVLALQTGTASAQLAERASVRGQERLDFESYGLALSHGEQGAATSGAPPLYAFTRAELETGYDSNVQRTESDTLASAYARFRPGVSVRAEGENATIFGTLEIDSTRYARSSEDASDDVELRVGVNHDTDEDLGFSASAGISRGHLDRSDDNDLGPGFDLTTFTDTSLNLIGRSAVIAGLPSSASANITYRRFDETNGVDRDGLNRVVSSGRARIGVAGQTDLVYFVQPGATRTVYTSDSTANSDSTRYDLAGGVHWDGSAVSSFSGFLGASYRQFDDEAFNAQTSLLAGASGIWNFTPIMTLRGGGSIANQDTGTAATSSALVSAGTISLDYDPMDNLILSASASFRDTDYEDETADEQRSSFGLSARYLLTENFYVDTGLSYQRQSSDIATNEFDATVASIRFGAKLCCLTDRLEIAGNRRRLRPTVVNNVFR